MIGVTHPIEELDGDAPGFIAVANAILIGVGKGVYDEIFVIRVDNWFDSKWLGYSGRSVVRFDGVRIESSLYSVWKDKTTLPPFNQNRIVEQRYFLDRVSETKEISRAIISAWIDAPNATTTFWIPN